MSVSVIKTEWKKLFSIPVIPFSVLICVIFNLIYLSRSLYFSDYLSYVSSFASKNGVLIEEGMKEDLAQQPESPYRLRLLGDVENVDNVFETLKTEEIFSFLKTLYPFVSDSSAMKNKYALLQKRVDVLKNETGVNEIAAASVTTPAWDLLFGSLLRLINLETVILAFSSAVLLSTYENHANCSDFVFSSKTRRSLYWIKYTVSLLFSLSVYVILTLSMFCNFNHRCSLYSLLASDVSSCFHYRQIPPGTIPFITWLPMKGWQYLLLFIILSLLLVMIFHGIGFIAGCYTDNSLKAILFGCISCFAAFEAVIVFSFLEWFVPYEVALMNPVGVLYLGYCWFTDCDIMTLFPMQECIVTAIWLLITILLLLTVSKHNQRKDILPC